MEKGKNKKACCLVEDSYNYGLGLLKIIMAFEVVLCHYWRVSNDSVFSGSCLFLFAWLRGLAVPVFLIISFYYLRSLAEKRDAKIYKKRLIRLIIPQIGWGFIYYIGYIIIEEIFDVKLVTGISDLGWQLLFGCSENLNPPMWFQVDLIFLTCIVFFIYYNFTEDRSLKIIFFMGLLALYMQYSGLNYKLFNSWRFETKHTFGRFMEVLPYAFLGLIFSYDRVEERMKKARLYYIPVLGLSLVMVFKFSVFRVLEEQFTYEGVKDIFMSGLLVLIFMISSFEKMPKRVCGIIKWLASYTPGIFCIHFGIGRLFMLLLEKREVQSYRFSQCIVIWIISYIIVFLISKVPLKLLRCMVQ